MPNADRLIWRLWRLRGYVLYLRLCLRKRLSRPVGGNTVYGCATCGVIEGRRHYDWCHRQGAMTRPEPSGGNRD